MSSGRNPLGTGTPRFCDHCGEPYREIKRLPGTVGYCSRCFEGIMTGEIDVTGESPSASAEAVDGEASG